MAHGRLVATVSRFSDPLPVKCRYVQRYKLVRAGEWHGYDLMLDGYRIRPLRRLLARFAQRVKWGGHIGVIVMGVIFVRVSCNSIECASKLLHSRDVAEYPALCDPKSTFHSGPSGFISGTASDLASDSSIINDTGYSTTSWAMASHGYRDTFISTAFVGLGS